MPYSLEFKENFKVKKDTYTLHIVYLKAACLPLNVVENQTITRSSVPAEQGRGNGARH